MFRSVSATVPITDVLVLAAHAVELQGLTAALRECSASDTGRHAMIQLGPRRIAIATVGVGLTAAGAGRASD